jgi:hypothetical protein
VFRSAAVEGDKVRSHDGHKNLSAATIVVFVSDAMTLRKELEKRGKVKPGPRQLASVFSLFFASEGISAAETCDVRGLEHVKLFFRRAAILFRLFRRFIAAVWGRRKVSE